MNCIVYEFIELIHSYIVEEKSKDGDKDFELLNTRKCRDGRDQDNALWYVCSNALYIIQHA